MVEKQSFILDSNVLIDYLNSDITALRILHLNIGTVCVPSVVLQEIEPFNVTICEQIGFRIIEPTLEQLESASKRHGKLSFQDRIFFAIACDEKMICVTNDSILRKACSEKRLKVFWGLEIMLELTGKGLLATIKAAETARKIREINPLYISEDILKGFLEKLLR